MRRRPLTGPSLTATPGGGSRHRPQTRWREPGWCCSSYTSGPWVQVALATSPCAFAGQAGRGAEVLQDADFAPGGAGVAHSAAVQDQAQAEAATLRGGHHGVQGEL